MENINTVIDGQLIGKIRTGLSPGCAPDILLDLIEAGLVEDAANEYFV